MASEATDLGDIMATLMAMGFEYQDGQDAITNGKLTVQAAVEWIIAGKPGNVVANQPTLKLNRNEAAHSSNPFAASAVQTDSSTPATPSGSEIQDIDMADDSVISRTHMSEKQQQIKIDFEERERQEARKKVQEDKRRKKLEKERILKEIQEDRQKQKLIKAKMDFSQIPEPVAVVQEKPPVTSASTVSQSDSSATTSIQVRLPSGQMFRETFSVGSSLNSVWDAVALNMKSALNAYSGFIQPFPRKEFTKEEKNSSLQSLGLTPSGLLVLKKKDADQASHSNEVSQPPPIGHFGEDEDEAEAIAVVEEEREDAHHNWGRGFRVEAEDIPPDEPGEGMGEDDRMEEEDDRFDQMFGLDNHPVFGHGRGQHRAFEGFGNRLVPEGVPADHGRHLNRTAANMAAEAAAHRFAQPRPVEMDEAESVSHAELLYTPQTLQIISMNILSRRITDPRTPIYTVNGLSDDLLQVFLDFLKKEKLLKPKVVYLMPSYLLKLNLDFYPYTTNELLHASRVLVNLQVVSLASCPLITDSGLNAFKELPSLQSLNLEETKVTDAGVAQLANQGCCPELLHLDLSRTSVTHSVIPVLANFKHLKSLRLKHSKIMSLSGIERIPSLESVDISETDVVTDSILCLTRLPNLCHVCLTGTHHIVGDLALSYMQGMCLTSLLLPSRTTTTDIGLSHITGFHLTSLDLTNFTHVGDPGMVHVGKLHSLKMLLLTNTRISDEGMQYLKELINLQVLFIDKTMVSNLGAAVVQNFRQLAELSLAGSSITSDLLKQEALNHCISLSKLNMSRTAIGDKGIKHLKLPNLTLLNLDCTRVRFHAVDQVKKNCPNVKSVTIANLSTEPEDEL